MKKRILFGVPLVAVVGVALVIAGVATGKVNRAQSASALPSYTSMREILPFRKA